MQNNCICAKSAIRLWGPLAALLALTSCENHEDDHDDNHENEVISRVVLTFTPTSGGAPLTYQFNDPDGDGGVSGTADRIELADGMEYTLALRFENALETPPEDITSEIKEEAEQHFIFILGDVAGPASTPTQALVTQAYADLESDYGDNAVGDDLPVGLTNTISATALGQGTLRIMLRHLPPLNDQPQKTGDLPGDLAAGRDLPGSPDVDVSFELVVS
ncbi:MAG: hypothetical protein R3B09_15270 [Nannocystaceae bacterium]